MGRQIPPGKQGEDRHVNPMPQRPESFPSSGHLSLPRFGVSHEWKVFGSAGVRWQRFGIGIPGPLVGRFLWGERPTEEPSSDSLRPRGRTSTSLNRFCKLPGRYEKTNPSDHWHLLCFTNCDAIGSKHPFLSVPGGWMVVSLRGRLSLTALSLHRPPGGQADSRQPAGPFASRGYRFPWSLRPHVP